MGNFPQRLVRNLFDKPRGYSKQLLLLTFNALNILAFLFRLFFRQFVVWSQHGLNVIARDGVLKDVLGLEDSFRSPWLWSQRSSPWPWPRSLKSSKIAMSLAEDSTILFERSKLGWKMLETLQKICSDFFLLFWRLPEKKFLKNFFLFCF